MIIEFQFYKIPKISSLKFFEFYKIPKRKGTHESLFV